MTDTCFGANRVPLTGVLDSGSASVMLRGVHSHRVFVCHPVTIDMNDDSDA